MKKILGVIEWHYLVATAQSIILRRLVPQS